MRSIADQINAEKNAGHKRTYTILMVPRKVGDIHVLHIKYNLPYCDTVIGIDKNDFNYLFPYL